MARNSGGFILIKISKGLYSVSESDFDKETIKKLWSNKQKKTLILETNDERIVFNRVYLVGGVLGYSYERSSVVSESGNLVIDSYFALSLEYDAGDDSLTFTITEY